MVVGKPRLACVSGEMAFVAGGLIGCRGTMYAGDRREPVSLGLGVFLRGRREVRRRHGGSRGRNETADGWALRGVN